mgnify:CR=1 FL=1
MAYINFDISINSSLQAGDMLYYTAPPADGIAGKPLPAGVVTSVLGPQGKVNYTPNALTQPSSGDFILFAKDIRANESSLKGYYADVIFTNRSNKRAELFAVSSEIVLSSK